MRVLNDWCPDLTIQGINGLHLPGQYRRRSPFQDGFQDGLSQAVVCHFSYPSGIVDDVVHFGTPAIFKGCKCLFGIAV